MTNHQINARKIGWIINLLIAALLYIGFGLICDEAESYNAHQEASQ